MKVWFSIRTKFLVVMSLLLGGCVAVYLVLATMVFKSDKTELVYDLSRSQVTTIASELDSQLSSLSDKLKLFALSAQGSDKVWVNDLLKEDENLAFVALYKADHKTIERQFTSAQFLETYAISVEEVRQAALAESLVPWEQVQKQGEYIWRLQLKDLPPLIGFARTVTVETQIDKKASATSENWTVVGWIRPDRLLKNTKGSKLSEVVVLNAQGDLLAHPDTKIWEKGESWKEHRLFQTAREAQVKTQVMSFSTDEGSFLGAFSKTYNSQLLVLSQAPESKAFAVLTTLIERSLIFALIVVTVAFLASVLLSRSLTNPIAELAETMESVGKGNLNAQAHVHSRDETMILANTFNKMITDLKTSRDELETMNRELDMKVKERTLQLEKQNLAVKEAQEALLRTTRLASAGEIAGRAAHEVLNPLTSLLTRMGLIEKRVKRDVKDNLGLLDEINKAWQEDYKAGGFDLLVTNWKKPSSVNPAQNLLQEDLANISDVSGKMHGTLQTLVEDSQFIQSEGQRINRIIHGMRKLSNMNSDLKPENVHVLLDECIKIMGDLFDAEDCKIEKKFTSKFELVKVDRDEFIQAITNMMRNSLQAIQVVKTAGFDRANKPALKIHTRSEGGQILIEIEDNGVGIASEYQNQLFDSNFTTKSKDEGTGIGLGIARRFLRGHGGDIEFVSSAPLKATVFRVRLPMLQTQEAAA